MPATPSTPWLSVHIYYYGDQNYLLVNCVAPLIDDLYTQGLIQHYFFIKYWLEGLHIRLRLQPARDADDEKIKYLVEEALSTFLQQRPALYEPPEQGRTIYEKMMFIQEYGAEEWERRYGEQGIIPVRPNNTFAYVPYEPEYERYGGEVGVALAEWHFEHSSDIVLRLLREANVTVQTMLLGLSIQLSLSFFYTLLDDDVRVINALKYYAQYWQNWKGNTAPVGVRDIDGYFEKKYRRLAPMLHQRIARIREYMQGTVSRQPQITLDWQEHLTILRQKMYPLIMEQQITFSRNEQWEGVGEYTMVAHRLLGSYVHMTNNRLGVTIPQEVYLAFLSRRTVEELSAGRRKEQMWTP